MLFIIEMALFIWYRDLYKLYTKNVEAKEWIMYRCKKVYLQEKETIKPNIDTSS